MIYILLALFIGVPFTHKPEVDQAVRGATMLKNRMRDPDSFTIERVFSLTDKHGDFVTCLEYHARNGFGGMDRNAAHYTEHKGKPHVDMNGSTGYGWCAVTKYYPYVDITKEFNDALKTNDTPTN